MVDLLGGGNRIAQVRGKIRGKAGTERDARNMKNLTDVASSFGSKNTKW